MEHFQGVVCCCLSNTENIQDNILSILDLKTPTKKDDIDCYLLELKNKYYQTTIDLFDYDELKSNKKEVFDNCHGIIMHCDGLTVTTGLLDEKVTELGSVGGEPRILLCSGINEDCEPYRTLLDWSIKNGYDLIQKDDEDVRIQMIDSLSAYKWQHRSNPTPSSSSSNKIKPGEVENGTTSTTKEDEKPQLNDELMKKLMDFDSLLGKLSAYRDQPELRGNPDDKNIVEIAEILSNLLGDDVDDFLESETSGQQSQQHQQQERGDNNNSSI